MQRLIIALASGLIFGAGLVISEMANPVKVQNFLDPFALALTCLGILLTNTAKNIRWKHELLSLDLWVAIIFRHLLYPSLVIGIAVAFVSNVNLPLNTYDTLLLTRSRVCSSFLLRKQSFD